MSKALKQTTPRPKAPLVARILHLTFTIAFFGCTDRDDCVLSASSPIKPDLVEASCSAQPGDGIATVGNAAGTMLPQEGNPINTALDGYKQYMKLASDPKKWGDILVYYQYPNGGWVKQGFKERGKGYASGVMDPAIKERIYKIWNTPAGYTLILDNGSTITEFATLGYTYRQYGDAAHKAAAQKTMELLLKAQRPTGGWQQYFPARPQAYSAHATFNDESMMRILISLQKAVKKEDPFDSDIFTEDQLTRAKTAIAKGIEFILRAQIRMNGKLTVWCAQHNMQTYAPEYAREYELPSKSGQESALIVSFLMSQPQTPEIAAAVKGALDWYVNPEVPVANTLYVRPKKKDGSSPYREAPGRKMWYRFYELNTNRPFFCDRDGKPVDDIQKIGEERFTGYVWAGPWGESLLEYAAKVGYVSSATGVGEPATR